MVNAQSYLLYLNRKKWRTLMEDMLYHSFIDHNIILLSNEKKHKTIKYPTYVNFKRTENV